MVFTVTCPGHGLTTCLSRLLFICQVDMLTVRMGTALSTCLRGWPQAEEKRPAELELILPSFWMRRNKGI